MSDSQAMQVVTPTSAEIAVHYQSDRLTQMIKMATEFHKANCFGKDVQNMQQALVKMQAGFEMGMPPIEAMNSLYIVNGHITIWGAAMTKRLRMRGWKIQYEDKDKECTVTITKGDESYSFTAREKDVKKAGAYAFAPVEKLRWHALSRLIRFSVPEVLDAGVAYLQEEAEDMVDFSTPIQASESVSVEDYEKQIEEAKTPEKLKEIAVTIQQDSMLVSDKQGLLGKILHKGKAMTQVDVVAEPVIDPKQTSINPDL